MITSRATSLFLALSLAACGGSSSGGAGTGRLEVDVTDAPIDVSLVDEAWISVAEVRVLFEGDEDPGEDDEGFQTIFDGPSRQLNLLELNNGVVQRLVEAELREGTIRQVRLVIDDAYLRLVNGNEYTTGDGSLHLTSQATAGFKVFVEPPIEIERGFSRRMLLDFDLSKTFLPLPANDPLAAHTYNLLPVLHATNVDLTGEVRGLVFHVEDGDELGLDQATVSLLPQGETNLDESVVGTFTDPDGSYALIGVLPGTYDVHARHGASEARIDGVIVGVGDAELVDVELP